MHAVLSAGIFGLAVTAGITGIATDRPTALTPEDVEKDRPQGTVAIRFTVASGGVLTGVARIEDPPYMPIKLDAKAKLGDARNLLYVVLVGKALSHVNQLGLGDPEAHFVGKTIEVSGKVRYLTLPRITKADGSVETPADTFTHYEIVVQSLDDFRVVQ
jgi:hypothetical protein